MEFDPAKVPMQTVYNLLVGLVAPRPIALVTSMDVDGRMNAAPFSSYNYLCREPPILGLGIVNRPGRTLVPKDTSRNIRRTGEFVVNVVTEDLMEKMNICSTEFPEEVNELELAGLTTAPSQHVKVPRIAEAHAAFECVEHLTIEIGETRIVLGRVVGIYVEDQFIDSAGPYVKADEMHQVGRMNGKGLYVHTRDALMTMPRISYEAWQRGER
ncbi:flavin reductase family protein [Granulicella sp. dw_53]|uniref:flavin reductase family protein n=1 Tax=Granulicella sp. dw_53 TaxID=2719792 RepID=UPI001BD59CCC|nr:flavin reductase family protein [Granulicella sp. dw_53]